MLPGRAVRFCAGRFIWLAAAGPVNADPCIERLKTGKLKGYKKERIDVIIDPDSADPRGYAYNTIQSMITVGKGGLSGIKGDTETSQSALKFLPEPHSDFIFAVTAENTGFIGCISLRHFEIFLIYLISRNLAGSI